MIKEVKVVKADRTERVKTANIAESAWRVKIQKQKQQTTEKHCYAKWQFVCKQKVCEALALWRPNATCWRNNNSNTKGSKAGAFAQLFNTVLHGAQHLRNAPRTQPKCFWPKHNNSNNKRSLQLSKRASLWTHNNNNNIRQQTQPVGASFIFPHLMVLGRSSSSLQRDRHRHRHRRGSEAEQRCQAIVASLVLFQCSYWSGRRTRIRQYNSA